MATVRRHIAPWLIAAVMYTGGAVAFTSPLVSHLSSAFPHDHYDPALIAVILGWNARTLPMTRSWWDASMFWPVRGALSFSEHLLGISLLTTPLQWSGATPLTAYNVAFLCSFPLTALAAHALAFALLKRHDAACLAGCVFGFSPYRVSHLAHLQMLWAFGMPLALMALHRFAERRERRWLVVFGLAWLAQASANGYYLMLFPVLLAGWVLWFAREPGSLVPITITWAVASLPLAPLLWRYSTQHAALGLSRHRYEIEANSADLLSPFAASPDLIVWHGLSRWSRPEGELFPGLIAPALIAVAIVIAASKFRTIGASAAWRRSRVAALLIAVGFVVIAVEVVLLGPWRWVVGSSTIASASSADKPLTVSVALVLFAAITSPALRDLWRRRSVFGYYVCGAAAMLMLSLGPRPTLAGTAVLYRAPYALLMEVPGFSELRVPARFGMLFVLCVAIAAAIAFARLTSTLRPLFRRSVSAIAVVLILFESWPRVTLAAPAASIAALSAIGDRAPVLELPLGIIERDVAAVYRSLEHHHPVVNGYSGYAPPHYEILRIGLRLGDTSLLDELAGGGSLVVAVDHGEQFDRWAAVVGPRPIIADEGGWRLYRVAASASPARPTGGVRQPIVSVQANLRNDAVAGMLDGDVHTAWSTGRAQAGGEELSIDLGRPADLSGVSLTLGPFLQEFPRRLSVECSGDRHRWDTCWSGSGASLALRAVLADPLTATMILPVTARAVRYLRVRQTGVDPVNGWAVAELAVFGTDGRLSPP